MVRQTAGMGNDMTGDELKTLRKRQGLSRPALAAMAGLHPDSVKYWERKPTVDLHGHAPDRILQALGLDELSQKNVYPAPPFYAQRGNFPALVRARVVVRKFSNGDA